MKKQQLFLCLSCALFCLLVLTGCKNPLKSEVAPPAATFNLDKAPITVQKLNAPIISTKDPNKILDLSYSNNAFFISLRSDDNTYATISAFKETENVLNPIKSFGKDGSERLDAKMILDVDMGTSGTVYFMQNGFHAYKNGADNISLNKKTSATRIAIASDEKSAYLYGNDNFVLATIEDNSVEKVEPSFLKNRAAPFLGGLSLIVLADDGIYGGGRIAPNGLNIVASFTKDGKMKKQYGKASNVAKDSINSLMSFAVLKDYVCVIDGFTFKAWRKDGSYLGSINNSDFLGDNSNAFKLTQVSDNTLAMLSYQRNPKTKNIDLEICKISF